LRSGQWLGVDNAWEQEKLKVWKKDLKNRQNPARFVGRIFLWVYALFIIVFAFLPFSALFNRLPELFFCIID
jgi:hypothetical protein